ncbi:MAG: hypothetical protein R2774_12990 [Saprospiraceae bacterium]
MNKWIFSIIILVFSTWIVHAQVTNPNIDSSLVKKYGGDDYGMKKFTLVILSTGDSVYTDEKFVSSCFRGHLDNIHKMVNSGDLIIAGPLGKNDDNYRGIFIFNHSDTEKITSLLTDDPAIRYHILKPTMYSWYGSAALPAYLDIADKIWVKKP